MRINNNIIAVNSHRQYGINAGNFGKNAERLSSGKRVNRAADDAAGLAVSEKMRSQIRGLNRAGLNVQDGISLVQVGDGALQTIHDIIHRIRELAIQAANDTNTLYDRKAIQLEIDQLTSEVNDITGQTEFNTLKLFDGSNMGIHMWNYGLRYSPMVTPKDAMQIFANYQFESVRVPRGSQAFQFPAGQGALTGHNTSIGNSHAYLIDGNFPLEGVFVIRVSDPSFSPMTRDFILNFAEVNGPGGFNGNMTTAQFEQFFQDAFDAAFGVAGAPATATRGATIRVTAAGIDVRTHGLGGNQSNVTIGATAGVALPPGTIFANSAIFGAQSSGIPHTVNFRIIGNRTITPAELNAINAGPPANSTLLWDLVPDSHTFRWEIQEWSLISGGNPNNAAHYFQSAVLHDFEITAAQLRAAGVTTFAQANTHLNTLLTASNVNPPPPGRPYFGSLSIGVPTIVVERDGTALINHTPAASPGIHDSSLPHRYRASVQAASSRTNVNAHAARANVSSNYIARPSVRHGYLTINIGNIPGIPGNLASITVDFSQPQWTAASTPQQLVDYINSRINDPAFHPNPPPVHTGAAFNPAMPVAVASIVGGNLVITASERAFSVNVQERMSDRPMFMNTRPPASGVNHTAAITITDNAGIHRHVTLVPGDFDTIEDFIRANQGAFGHGLTLSAVDGALVITGGMGEQYTASNISLTGTGGHDWVYIFERIGFRNVVVNDANMFVDGYTHPPEPVEDRSLWIQGGANAFQGLRIGIPRLNAQDLGIMIRARNHANPDEYFGISKQFGTSAFSANANVTMYGTTERGFALDVTTREHAEAALAILDNAIAIISEERANFGAKQNRLEYKMHNLANQSENISAAESRIRDADMAAEMTEFTRNNILHQASTAMLAQANALPQTVLQLLG